MITVDRKVQHQQCKIMNLKEELEALEEITLSTPMTQVDADRIELFVKADENDGDYINLKSKVDIPTMQNIIPIAKKILTHSKSSKWGYNWGHECEDYLSEEDKSFINDYIPPGEYELVHTIKEFTFKLKLTTGEIYIINY